MYVERCLESGIVRPESEYTLSLVRHTCYLGHTISSCKPTFSPPCFHTSPLLPPSLPPSLFLPPHSSTPPGRGGGSPTGPTSSTCSSRPQLPAAVSTRYNVYIHVHVHAYILLGPFQWSWRADKDSLCSIRALIPGILFLTTIGSPSNVVLEADKSVLFMDVSSIQLVVGLLAYYEYLWYV